MANYELTNDHNDTFYGIASQYFMYPSMSLPEVWGLQDPKLTTIHDPLNQGYAAIRWYKARGDERFLEVARAQWGLAYHATVSQETRLPNGTMRSKGFPVPASCQAPFGNITLEGATFRNASLLSDDGMVSLYGSVLYSLLSALLAQAEPSNTTYVQAATLSLDFLLREGPTLQREADKQGLPLSQLTGEGCDRVSIVQNELGAFGFYVIIEAMSIIYSISGSDDMGKKIQESINTLFTSGLITKSSSPGGVLLNKNQTWLDGPYSFRYDGDVYLLRALAEVYRREEGILPTDIREDIKRLLGVQVGNITIHLRFLLVTDVLICLKYNAIRDLATSGNNVYSRNWAGPRPTQVTFNVYNQAAAAQVLVDGISIFNGSSDTSPLPNPSAMVSHKPAPAVIAGATVGSVVFLSVLVLAIFRAVRQWRGHFQTNPSTRANSTVQILEPFVATASEKGTTCPDKQPVPEPRTLPEAHLRPLRQYSDSAPSTFREGTELLVERRGINESPNIRINTSVDFTSFSDGAHSVEDMETPLTVSDIVRILYQHISQHNGLESPPDYRSNLGESPQRVWDAV
ncbi:hypothetical protein PQX77_006589 [Marasmius sp. AFHP31]|nr:hypothetical protein PQX77_006589 [Marasmius sp. AFHP31]